MLWGDFDILNTYYALRSRDHGVNFGICVILSECVFVYLCICVFETMQCRWRVLWGDLVGWRLLMELG